jgi:hypothetical protein
MSAVDLAALPRPVVEDHPEFVALYEAAWRIAGRHVATHPNGRRFMDVAWGKPDQLWEWVWDSCFIALFCRYAPDQFPGMASLDNFYDLQRADGYISMTYDMRTGQECYPNRINPPLFAWVEWEHYRTTGDPSRFERAIPAIERLMAWIDANRRARPWRRDTEESLYCFEDCGSSGMDDSPRTPRDPEAGRFFEWIDLSSQMALSFRCLAKMHTAIGRAERAAHWQGRAERLSEAINRRLWSDRTRFYHDRAFSARLVAAKTAASFWPLLAGVADQPRRDALVEHLLDEREFNRPIPVPTLSADDPNYSPQGEYWVGGVWPPTNYMIVRGLSAAGRPDVAHGVALRYLSGLARTCAELEPHTIWECQSPEEPKPGLTCYTRQTVKPDFVGWGGVGPIAMLIENVLGIEANAAERRIEWTLRLAGRHGIENLSLGRCGKATLLCAARCSPDAPARVEIAVETPMEVVVRCAGREKTFRARPGAAAALTV